jgi:hypothetical protein
MQRNVNNQIQFYQVRLQTHAKTMRASFYIGLGYAALGS